ncbi:archaellin/type IV pilin N-terminal domain-containing protein [Halorubrum vacuolatum]|uniref:Flagellin N-terminal-like domain-containing protein n=1 Tax=Halorubrum vacuolatum TaxID=63740 RepID=A0A238W1Q4_HALVU|nr:archaellin/type IV pilin N-terminal domain-containing protein [Halorubrum vacuolatum]SNR40535.1 flagellin N-terminal-like domain-containing protein [Halorubrum vacuolatum]
MGGGPRTLTNRDRGVTPVVGIVLIVAIVVVLAATVSVVFFDVTDELTEPQEPRVFGDAEVVLGAEHRSWNGWDAAEGEPDRGDVDAVRLTYEQGPTFEGDEIGSILVR